MIDLSVTNISPCKFCDAQPYTLFVEPIYNEQYGVCQTHLKDAQLNLEWKAYKDLQIPPRKV